MGHTRNGGNRTIKTKTNGTKSVRVKSTYVKKSTKPKRRK